MTGAVPDLATWLLEQIAEDERVALAASPGPWHPNAEHDEILAVDDITVADGFALSGQQQRATVDHIVHWDPTRVLAECDAKRRVVAMHKNAIFAQGQGSVSNRNRIADETAVDLLGEALQVLALPYADRPGYREEWRP